MHGIHGAPGQHDLTVGIGFRDRFLLALLMGHAAEIVLIEQSRLAFNNPGGLPTRSWNDLAMCLYTSLGMRSTISPQNAVSVTWASISMINVSSSPFFSPYSLAWASTSRVSLLTVICSSSRDFSGVEANTLLLIEPGLNLSLTWLTFASVQNYTVPAPRT